MSTDLNMKYISDFSSSNSESTSSAGGSGPGLGDLGYHQGFSLTSQVNEYLTRHFPGPREWEHQFLTFLNIKVFHIICNNFMTHLFHIYPDVRVVFSQWLTEKMQYNKKAPKDSKMFWNKFVFH